MVGEEEEKVVVVGGVEGGKVGRWEGGSWSFGVRD